VPAVKASNSRWVAPWSKRAIDQPMPVGPVALDQADETAAIGARRKRPRWRGAWCDQEILVREERRLRTTNLKPGEVIQQVEVLSDQS